ncbi:helix-turn-helix domain-containing protein [Cognatishimia sp. SS12]|uniref:IclR family transcriptional regulator domain-containing protein n=1 Tax=Cognatishimia sp. SS12 TaxID=2979465 RepID=UPI00232E7B59|nr:helix-turn-helix domain-containing protein [Cognatishimia sp. SS12]MDC0739346.1 helix-turn-helix domain-containing protein [Cognatishimia sp. SS12]
MGIRAIERAINVLAELNRRPITTVRQLHAATQLPKPTIVRILQTFEELGLVDGDSRLGGYQITAQVAALSSGYWKDPMVVEAGRSWAVALTRRHKWPVAIALLDGTEVTIRFSTIPNSTISPFHSSVGRKLPILTRGLGLAYFAFASDERRAFILRLLAGSDDPEAQMAREPSQLAHLVESIRRAGYATRLDHVEPKNSDTIGVPIYDPEGEVAASLGMTYFRSAYDSSKSAADEIVPHLQRAASEITTDLKRLSATLGTPRSDEPTS